MLKRSCRLILKHSFSSNDVCSIIQSHRYYTNKILWSLWKCCCIAWRSIFLKFHFRKIKRVLMKYNSNTLTWEFKYEHFRTVQTKVPICLYFLSLNTHFVYSLFCLLFYALFEFKLKYRFETTCFDVWFYHYMVIIIPWLLKLVDS